MADEASVLAPCPADSELMKAWNAYKAGKSIKALKWAVNEACPAIE